MSVYGGRPLLCKQAAFGRYGTIAYVLKIPLIGGIAYQSGRCRLGGGVYTVASGQLWAFRSLHGGGAARLATGAKK